MCVNEVAFLWLLPYICETDSNGILKCTQFGKKKKNKEKEIFQKEYLFQLRPKIGVYNDWKKCSDSL